MARIGFEGLAGSNEENEVPEGYAGLIWGETRVAGRHFSQGLGGGFDAVRHGEDVAYTTEGMAGIAAATEEGSFTLKSGHFAAGSVSNLTVTFQSFIDGVLVGEKTVTLDQEDTVIDFGRRFKNVDVVGISAESDEVAFDNLAIRVHDGAAAAAPPVSDAEAAYISEALGSFPPLSSLADLA